MHKLPILFANVYEVELKGHQISSHPINVATVTDGKQRKFLAHLLVHFSVAKVTNFDPCPVVTYPRKLCEVQKWLHK